MDGIGLNEPIRDTYLRGTGNSTSDANVMSPDIFIIDHKGSSITFVLNLNLSPCFFRTRVNAVVSSLSIEGHTRSKNSTTVTVAPNRDHTEPISNPITPPPISTMLLGTCNGIAMMFERVGQWLPPFHPSLLQTTDMNYILLDGHSNICVPLEYNFSESCCRCWQLEGS